MIRGLFIFLARQLVLLICLPALLFSQKVELEQTVEKFSEGYHASFRLTIPFAKKELVEKEWRDFLKINKAKLKTVSSQINAENVLIPAVSSDTFRVYSEVEDFKDNVILKVAFSKGAVFLSSAVDRSKSEQVEKVLQRFGIETARTSLSLEIEALSKELSGRKKQSESLLKSNRRLSESNENMKQQIEGNEKTMEENNSKLETLTAEMKDQEQVLKSLENKKSELK